MTPPRTDDVRADLEDRRRRLQEASGRMAGAAGIAHLLDEVDDALRRLDDGTWGLCDTCHDPVEEDRLRADPLLRTCLDHLTPAEQRALEDDLSLAARIQTTMLPTRDLALGGWEAAFHYQPAGTVSGDYCDLIAPAAPGGDVFFLLGDVAGKGVAASMLMAGLRAILRTLMDAGSTATGDLAARANRLFCESTLPSHFATLVIGRAAATGEVEICNAGHPPPLVLADGGTTAIEPTGLPLGLFCEGRYDVRRVRLAPGEALLLYSDGLSEARDAAEREYGPGRLAAIAGRATDRAPRRLLEACLADLRAFRGGAAATDDLTLLAIRRAPRAARRS